ncbi:MAG: hypothetical protein H7A49_10360 [Akkermansiaceae bacterium]|nr:hypothetical protein [Akkermansiaceae bacterium]MCP5544291.1 hypothetical protein [Akkermansiaceae bacterium]MCP5546985.1 hypothetical protein [Akkermansiaceae bacterium]
MTTLLEIVIRNGSLFDAFGVIGLGLVAYAAIRLARREHSWGGHMMAAGAIAVLIARLYLVLAPHFVNDNMLHAIGPIGISLTIGLPPLMLTLGLAGVVWGLWGHERWLKTERNR